MWIGRVVRGAAWAIAGVTLLAAVLYLTLLIINWSDETPSDDALRLERVATVRSPVADEENAYVLLLGLSAPKGQDALALGRTRKAFLEAFRPSDRTEFAALPGTDADYEAKRPKHLKDLAEACKDGDAACATKLKESRSEVVAWLESEDWLLERYAKLIELDRWRETLVSSPVAPLPKYHDALAGQQLLLMKAWLLAHEGEADGAQALLESDLTFWRMVLRSSDLLITKMIATAAIQRHFAMGNLVLKEAYDRGLTPVPPASWSQPISREERSMLRAFAGEWRFTNGALEGATAWTDTSHVAAGGITDRLSRPFLKAQATSNLFAANMVRLIDGVAVDFGALPLASSVLKEDAEEQAMFRLYNPVGRVLANMSAGSGLEEYALRVADLEGARRAALLTNSLRARSDRTYCSVQDSIGSSTLRNPYTSAPFQWDPAAGTVIFEGLANWRSRRVFLL